MKSGLGAASGRHPVVIHGVGRIAASDIVKVYRMLQVENYDIVKTFRVQRFDGLYLGTLSRVYILFRIFFPSGSMLRDIISKPKVLTRYAYEKTNLVSNEWFTIAEIMIAAWRIEEKIGEVSTIFYGNERRGCFVPISAIFEFLKNLPCCRLFNKR